MAKLIEFRKKYDFLQDEFRKCYDEREILMNTIRKFEATKPEAYDSSGAISLTGKLENRKSSPIIQHLKVV